MYQLLVIIFVLFLQGITSLNPMLGTNETLFSIAQWSLSDSKLVLKFFSNCGGLLQYSNDPKFLGFVEYWTTLPIKGKISRPHFNSKKLTLAPKRWAFQKLGSPKLIIISTYP
jgi:hypothetical protein